MFQRTSIVTKAMLLQRMQAGYRKLCTELRREFHALIQRLDDLDTELIERLRNHNRRIVRLERPAAHAA